MKKIFVIDWALLSVFAITAITGFELHLSGHFSSHEVWHNWAVCHTLASLAFIILGYFFSKNSFLTFSMNMYKKYDRERCVQFLREYPIIGKYGKRTIETKPKKN